MTGLLSGVVLWLAAAVPAMAQSNPAQEAFAQAQAAVDAGRLTDARDSYRESLELEPRVPTAFNLAGVLRAIGELLAAERLLDETLGERYGAVGAAQREPISALLNHVRAEISVIEVTGIDAAGAELRIDGRQVGMLSEGRVETVRTDPGDRVVTVVGSDGREAARTLTLERGQTLPVELTLPPPEDHPDPIERPGPVNAPPRIHVDGGGLTGLQVIGVTSLTIGALAGIGALVTGLMAHARYEDLDEACLPDGACPAARQNDIDTGSTLATVSTVLTVVGIVGAGTGLTLVLVGGSGGDEPTTVTLSPAGISAQGSF